MPAMTAPSLVSVPSVAARPLWPGLALAGAGAIAFSGKAIIVKLAYRHGVDAVTLIMYRMLFALPLFALLAWWAGRGKPALTARDRWTVLGLGFSAATAMGLRELGHRVEPFADSYQDYGAGQFIWRLGDPAVDGYAAASDPRRDGQAAGY